MIKCTYCGELLSGDREICLGCGRSVVDPSRSVERRLRALLIGAFVAGGLLMLIRMIRDSVSQP